MSRIVEIVVPEVSTALNKLEEQFAFFGGEQISTDPRTFLFNGRIRLTLNPTAPYISNRLTEKLRAGAESLVLDESFVLEWAARGLSKSDAILFHNLLENIPKPFAVTIESGTGEGVELSTIAASLAFDVIDSFVRGETSHDLNIVIVEKNR